MGIYACTIKSHDILKAKNFLVKSVYYITDYTVCIVVTYFKFFTFR